MLMNACAHAMPMPNACLTPGCYRFPYETGCPLSPSLEPEPCPSDHQDVVLDSSQHSTLILLDVSFKKGNFYAMDITLKTTCNYEDPNHLSILVSKLFKRMVVDGFVYHKYCKTCSCIMILTLQLEHYC